MRTTMLATAAAMAALILPVSAQDARTTRIETRPFYGATVTIEEGVRVFRALPAHDRVIINPGGRTSLNLSIEEHRTTSHNYNYERPAPAAVPSSDGSAGAYLPVGPRAHRGHHGAPHGGRGGASGVR